MGFLLFAGMALQCPSAGYDPDQDRNDRQYEQHVDETTHCFAKSNIAHQPKYDQYNRYNI